MGRPGRPVAFLDRDGTVIHDPHYLADPERVELIRGAAGAIRRLREAGLAVVLVTNQAGIARGLYTEAEYRAVAARVIDVLRDAGAAVDATYHCPHHPDIDGACDCRKPATGLYLRAAREHDLDLGDSYCVGDKLTDVEPARSMGGQGILVRTGFGTAEEASLPSGVLAADDLAAAVELILRDRRLRAVDLGSGAP